jgi:hypothetical protein
VAKEREKERTYIEAPDVGAVAEDKQKKSAENDRKKKDTEENEDAKGEKGGEE